MSLKLADCDDKLRARIQTQIEREDALSAGANGGKRGVKQPTRRAQGSVAAPARVLSAEDKLNRTEKRWLNRLRERYSRATIRVAAIRLELAARCTYLPDFSVTFENSQTVHFFEVKGAFIRDDAVVKLKAAARSYPEWNFYLAQWKNDLWAVTLMPK